MILRAACACTVLLLGCAESKGKGTEPPGSEGSGTAAGGSGSCPGGGPSVSLNVRGRASGDDLPNDELGVLLGWIGGFAQPCREAPAEVPHFTLEIQLAEPGLPATFALVERDALPGLAACLADNFAKAPPPPPGPMTVEIVIPWGCPTLGPGFTPGSTKATQPAATEPTPP
jgi:hypothetical protein